MYHQDASFLKFTLNIPVLFFLRCTLTVFSGLQKYDVKNVSITYTHLRLQKLQNNSIVRPWFDFTWFSYIYYIAMLFSCNATLFQNFCLCDIRQTIHRNNIRKYLFNKSFSLTLALSTFSSEQTSLALGDCGQGALNLDGTPFLFLKVIVCW